MAKKHSIYFADFIRMAECSVQAAEHLQASLREFCPETLQEQRDVMHEIEHREDEIKHEIIRRLAKEFVTPIDREDIVQLAGELDDVTDKIDDILIRLYMYNVKTVREEALVFADVILRCTKSLHVAMVEFPNFHKSTTLKQAIIEVNTMEEDGDALYIAAVRRLFEEGCDNPLEVAAWSELFDQLEECCDACEHVADVLEVVALKNS